MIVARPDIVTRIGIGLDHAESLSMDEHGTIFAGGEKGQVYRIAPGGTPEIIAETGGDLLGSALDAAGNLYVCDCSQRAVWCVDPDGALRPLSRGTRQRPLTFPNHPAFDADGNLYVSDSGDYWDPVGTGSVHVIRPDGRAEVLHDGPFRFTNGISVDPSGEWLYVAQSAAWNVVRIPLGRRNGPIEPAFQLAPYTIPDGIVFTEDGVLLVACYKPDLVLACHPGGRIEVLVEDPTGELLLRPTNVVLSDEQLYVANLGGRWISRFDLPGWSDELRHRPAVRSA